MEDKSHRKEGEKCLSGVGSALAVVNDAVVPVAVLFALLGQPCLISSPPRELLPTPRTVMQRQEEIHSFLISSQPRSHRGAVHSMKEVM